MWYDIGYSVRLKKGEIMGDNNGKIVLGAMAVSLVPGLLSLPVFISAGSQHLFWGAVIVWFVASVVFSLLGIHLMGEKDDDRVA